MPLYRYHAVSEDGKKIVAAIDAENIHDAKQKLIRRKIVAIHIFPLEEKKKKKALSKGDVLCLTRELARLLQAGLALYEALCALEEKYRGHKPHQLLLSLCEQVKIGRSFSQGLSHYSNIFDVLYVSMVANAEKTGGLTQCLEELACLLERQLHVRKQVIGALLYPSLLFLFCLTVLASLLFFVIPSLKELFSGRDLHPFTNMVFAISQFACDYWMILFGVSVIITVGLAIAFCMKKWRDTLCAGALRLPILKDFFAKLALIRFSRALATLLEGGLPLTSALFQARAVMGHPILERVITKAEERISQGEPLSAPFMHQPLIPPLFPRMLGIAEQSGRLSFTMQQIARIYEDELEASLMHFTTIAQPALLLFLGVLVGFVLLSVLLPLTDVSSFVS